MTEAVISGIIRLLTLHFMMGAIFRATQAHLIAAYEVNSNLFRRSWSASHETNVAAILRVWSNLSLVQMTAMW